MVGKKWSMVTKKVALRKESVDRNCLSPCMGRWRIRSLSARRAWIEIELFALNEIFMVVALRKESVDRNWIASAHDFASFKVALRKESVDRNIFMLLLVLTLLKSRSPQGERG